MHGKLYNALSRVPTLGSESARLNSLPCKICSAPAPFFDIVDFNKGAGCNYRYGPSGIPVIWHRCSACGFLFTPFFDDWTSEDFKRFIYNDDYDIIDPDYAS